MKVFRYILLCAVMLISGALNAQEIAVDNFIVKENLLKNDKIAIIAANAEEKPIDSVNGVFQFSINGFKQELKFNDGVAIPSQQIDKSTFVYIKHTNDSGTHAKLYYVLKKEDNLNPVKINWLILLIIPMVLLLLIMMFRKFILIGGAIIIVLLVFNHSQGLGIGTFFETVFDGLRSMF